MAQVIFQVDAFTDTPFKGNPAAVCVLPQPADENWMQALAMEMNLSETAFVVCKEKGFGLRWFTPACEVALCGHATLATSHILWSEGYLGEDQPAVFETLSGRLKALRLPDGWIQLDFPATAPEPIDPDDGLLAALGLVDAEYVGRSRHDKVVVVNDASTVRALKPDITALARVPARGVIVTAPGDEPDLDFVSRFFGPNVGVNEDPVTGSAHCCLTPYWAQRLGKRRMRAYQASTRGGYLKVEIARDRVRLEGQAVTVFRGELV